LPKYYEINEETAKAANMANSFRDYIAGSAAEIYQNYVDHIYEVLERIKEEKPHLAEKAEGMADRYSRKLAEYYNAYYRNEASCPSILVSGRANFPVREKEKQNRRRESLNKEWRYLEGYAKKIENLLTMEQPILSSDENAIELLRDKINKLEAEQAKMKAVNAYYRKNKTLDGCPELTSKQIEILKAEMISNYHYENKPFMSFQLSNNNAVIKNTKKRLDELLRVKEDGTCEKENRFFKVVENTELMRLQLIFEGKPEPEVRDILKSNGFKWSPKNVCWQRQLTENAKYSAEKVFRELERNEAEL
jgi:hypothetical protein